jgi:tetratricopeptide (TPR) repeat protein
VIPNHQLQRRLLAASGFCELGLFQEAVEELEGLPVEVKETRGVLSVWLAVFPDCAIIHFNLACYDAQLGRLAEARKRLRQAIQIDEGFATLARKDPDLEPIRDEVE